MIPHKAEGVDLPSRFLASLAKGFQEAEAIVVIEVNEFPTVAAIHDVVYRSRILNA